MSQREIKLIAHRGNFNGPEPDKENDPSYIMDALQAGYEVEVDIWWDGRWWTGHDRLQYEVSKNFILHPRLWCHAKNTPALQRMLSIGAHCFWHSSDRHTLTSQGYIWGWGCAGDKSIVVIPGMDAVPTNCLGICSDYVGRIKERITK